eukprot:scaffold452063_cov43-Prasinocladus_malaysianus.AAC.1
MASLLLASSEANFIYARRLICGSNDSLVHLQAVHAQIFVLVRFSIRCRFPSSIAINRTLVPGGHNLAMN